MENYIIRVLLAVLIIIGGIILTLLIFPNFWVLLLITWIVIEILLVYILKFWKMKEN